MAKADEQRRMNYHYMADAMRMLECPSTHLVTPSRERSITFMKTNY